MRVVWATATAYAVNLWGAKYHVFSSIKTFIGSDYLASLPGSPYLLSLRSTYMVCQVRRMGGGHDLHIHMHMLQQKLLGSNAPCNSGLTRSIHSSHDMIAWGILMFALIFEFGKCARNPRGDYILLAQRTRLHMQVK